VKTFDILTLFPDFFSSPLQQSILAVAQKKKKMEARPIDLRDFSGHPLRHLDDTPYGGGAGMILKPEPFFRAYDYWQEWRNPLAEEMEVVMFTPRGVPLTQTLVRQLSNKKHFLLLCGHYKAIDERVFSLATQEISLGDYVVSGGEFAALCFMDALTRLIPGVLGNMDSADSDSFEDGLLDCPYYTRPEKYRNMDVPPVLLSGNHQAIAEWRKNQKLEITQQKRPGLLQKKERSSAD